MRAFTWFLRFISWFPLPVIHLMAWPAGQLLRLSKRHRQVSRKNLSMCLPELSATAREQLVKSSLNEFAKSVFEAGANWYWPIDKITDKVKKVHGLELVDDARKTGKGLILAAPHFGAWEWAASYMPVLFPDEVLYLYKPSGNPTLDKLILEKRQRGGGQPVPANTRGLRSLLKGLRNDKVAAVLPDQQPRKGDGAYAPFYGVPALTQTLIPSLVQRTDAKVIFMVMSRLSRGKGFELHFLAADEALYSADQAAALTALNLGVENCIAVDPKQYLWAYKRFGLRPNNEPRFY
ncbi:MAG: lysophospholipid acyltransferase family protein [Xanthomonadales bacterium]|nr:lysophospholipid acyltransferase family protein [Xanthomonadales bacterium]